MLMTLVDSLLKQAEEKFPCSISYRGRLTEKEREELERKCRVTTPAVYMSGECVYVIRLLKKPEEKFEL